MAWQSPSAMNAGGAAGTGDGNAPTGTEYTLQGVMRFLQLEWHSHERARNAWDIERAEMKAKIAKQEGEVRSAKKLNDQLNKHIRMLEQALTNERAKNKAGGAGANAQSTADEKKGKAKVDPKSGMGPVKPQTKHHNSFLDVDPESAEHAEAERERDSIREQSKMFLTKCVEEITYLLTPPAQPAPHPGHHGLDNSSGFLNNGQPSLDDLYRHQGLPTQLPTAPGRTLPNHAPPVIPTSVEILPFSSSTPHPQSTPMTRDPPGPIHQPTHADPSPFTQPQQQEPPPQNTDSARPDEVVEQLIYTFDKDGNPIPTPEEHSLGITQVPADNREDWDFDPPESSADNTTEMPLSGRPDEPFPKADSIPATSPPRQKRKTSAEQHRRRVSQGKVDEASSQVARSDPQNFKVRFALRGHLDVVRSVIFTGGGSPAEPEICTAGDDGMIKRWIIPASYANQHSMNTDLDISPYWSHRGHDGIVTSLAACPSTASFATGGRVSGDGWIFSGGQDATIRVWERGRVDPKATLDGHTDAVWTVCVLPATCHSVFGADCSNYGGPDRVLLASGSADGTIKIWAVSAPPQPVSPQTGSRRGVGGSRRHSVTSGSNYPSSPQPSIATSTPFHYMLVHTIERATHPSPTCISPLSPNGENFVVSFTDASILVYDTRTGEELIGMASAETYDGTPATGITSVVTTSQSIEGTSSQDATRGSDEEGAVHGPTGSGDTGGVEGVIISGHEDQFIRFYDANSGQCTYNMLAHPAAISSLAISKDGHEAVSAGHDASIRFWSLDKRICTQEITAHRIMRGEGVCSVVWSQDGRLVVSAGGDGVVKVFAR
ncbi:WD40 repeat-like protein [Bimuria novae-zelandiae CBS 107.79]|uniref:WD40 repeat-like protein n=1 Tax=Bimuria novae-zelandiae CBS 107.79 TaxID=1447943 RepID=A0A6A5V9N5_9PLEO|nr:WD40 repeat-like protein [Bimuria novae-zelandiae CBS 107.79]